MKFIVVIVFAIAALGCEKTGQTLPPGQAPPEIGRFSIMQVQYLKQGMRANGELYDINAKEIFKIDSATGEVWQLAPETIGAKNSKDFWYSMGK